MNPTPPQAAGSLNRFLNAIEAAGNKLPHITMLFIWGSSRKSVERGLDF